MEMDNSSSNNFLKGISVQTIISFASALLQLVVFAIFSRLLSREDFGYYAALMGIITIFTSISDAGIGASIIQKAKPSIQYLSTAFTLSLIAGVISKSGSSEQSSSRSITPFRVLPDCMYKTPSIILS